MRKRLLWSSAAAGCTVAAALWIAGGEPESEPLRPAGGGVDAAPSEGAAPLPPAGVARAEGTNPEEVPEAAAPAAPPSRKPALPEPWQERPVVVHGTLVELLEVGKREPSREVGGRQVTLKVGRRSDPAVPTLTGPDGSFRFEFPPQEERPFVYTLRVAGDEKYRPVRHQRNVEHGESDSGPQLLRRVLQGHPRGRVVDHEGRALSGVGILCGAGVEPVAFSGIDGGFELKGRREFDVTGVETPGYRLRNRSPSVPRKLGGWSPGTLSLWPVTRLVVRVVGVDEAPVAGARIEVVPVDGEGWETSVASTDPDGRAELEAVWCGRPLELTVKGEDLDEVSREHRGWELLFGDEGLGRAIVLPVGPASELVARVSDGLRIHGRIVDLEGREVEVQVRTVARPGAYWPVPVGGDGTFEFVVPLELRTQPLIVTAREERDRTVHRHGIALDPVAREGLARQGRNLVRLGDPIALARAVVDPTRALDGRLEIVLSLEAGLSIRGTLVGEWPAGGEVFAVRAGAPDPLEAHRESEMARLLADRRSFVLPDLAPGAYDVVVASRQRGWGSGIRIVPGVPAGSGGLEIAFPGTDEVRVQLVPGDETVELKEVRVLAERFVPELPGWSDPRPGHLSRPFGWMESGGSRGEIDAGSSVVRSSMRFRGEPVVELPPAQAGDYRLRVLADSTSGEAYAGVTGPVLRLEKGSHTVSFALIPAGEARVDCSSVGTGGFSLRLHHAVRGDVPIDGWWDRGELSIGRRKHVLLRRIPAGTYELRVGAAEDLARGVARWRVPVEIRANERARVRVGPP